jgi:imidazolonepropionase-like amidohydrolase
MLARTTCYRRRLECSKSASVTACPLYGTDLLGQLQVAQSEFTLRAQVLSPAEIIRSATTVGARIVRMEGKLGCLKPGALADLLVVDGNPLKNLKLFGDEGQHLSVIMKGGRFHKNRLH